MTRSALAAFEKDSDHVGNLLQPDPILPSQLYTSGCGERARGERRLILAILEDAVGCYQKYLLARDNRGRRLFRDAEQWLGSSSREMMFSFENICDILGLDAQYMREQLFSWRERQLAARASLYRGEAGCSINGGTIYTAA